MMRALKCVILKCPGNKQGSFFDWTQSILFVNNKYSEHLVNQYVQLKWYQLLRYFMYVTLRDSCTFWRRKLTSREQSDGKCLKWNCDSSKPWYTLKLVNGPWLVIMCIKGKGIGGLWCQRFLSKSGNRNPHSEFLEAVMVWKCHY